MSVSANPARGLRTACTRSGGVCQPVEKPAPSKRTTAARNVPDGGATDALSCEPASLLLWQDLGQLGDDLVGVGGLHLALLEGQVRRHGLVAVDQDGDLGVPGDLVVARAGR